MNFNVLANGLYVVTDHQSCLQSSVAHAMGFVSKLTNHDYKAALHMQWALSASELYRTVEIVGGLSVAVVGEF
jgi:hypothetical protein